MKRKKKLTITWVKVSVELPFMEVVEGCTKNIVFHTELPCEACVFIISGGSGVPPGTSLKHVGDVKEQACQLIKRVHIDSRSLALSVVEVENMSRTYASHAMVKE